LINDGDGRAATVVDFKLSKYLMIPECQPGLSPSVNYFQFLFRQYWKHGNVCDDISQNSLRRENSEEDATAEGRF